MNQQVEKSSIYKFLEHPTIMYLLIGVVSIFASVILFKVGGSLAEITGQENTIVGFGFKAGGAVGGFLLIFWTSPKVIAMLNNREKRISMKLYLIGKPKSFDRSDKTYTCKFWIFNEETGDRKESPSFKPRWEAGFLTIDIKDVGADDMIAAQVKNAQKDVWECDYFLTRAHTTEAKLLENNGKEDSTDDSKN